MCEVKIRLENMENAKKLVNILTKYQSDVDLMDGRVAIDAKSILGVCSVDLSKKFKLVIHDIDKEKEKILEEINPYIIKEDA